MGLMLKARWKALLHSLPRTLSRDHRTIRVYSHFGFKTRVVFCECGKVFGSDGTYNTDHLIAAYRLRREWDNAGAKT